MLAAASASAVFGVATSSRPQADTLNPRYGWSSKASPLVPELVTHLRQPRARPDYARGTCPDAVPDFREARRILVVGCPDIAEPDGGQLDNCSSTSGSDPVGTLACTHAPNRSSSPLETRAKRAQAGIPRRFANVVQPVRVLLVTFAVGAELRRAVAAPRKPPPSSVVAIDRE